MAYSQHPELSHKFPAIDGIVKERREAGYRGSNEEVYFLSPQKAIRSDVEEILMLDDINLIDGTLKENLRLKNIWEN